jgi:hypothetical protein
VWSVVTRISACYFVYCSSFIWFRDEAWGRGTHCRRYIRLLPSFKLLQLHMYQSNWIWLFVLRYHAYHHSSVHHNISPDMQRVREVDSRVELLISIVWEFKCRQERFPYSRVFLPRDKLPYGAKIGGNSDVGEACASATASNLE